MSNIVVYKKGADSAAPVRGAGAGAEAGAGAAERRAMAASSGAV